MVFWDYNLTMTKTRCPKCGEKNDIQNDECFYCASEIDHSCKSNKPVLNESRNLGVLVGVPLFFAVMIPFALNSNPEFSCSTPNLLQSFVYFLFFFIISKLAYENGKTFKNEETHKTGEN